MALNGIETKPTIKYSIHCNKRCYCYCWWRTLPFIFFPCVCHMLPHINTHVLRAFFSLSLTHTYSYSLVFVSFWRYGLLVGSFFCSLLLLFRADLNCSIIYLRIYPHSNRIWSVTLMQLCVCVFLSFLIPIKKFNCLHTLSHFPNDC